MVFPNTPLDRTCLATSVLVCVIFLLLIWSNEYQTTDNKVESYDHVILLYSGSIWMGTQDLDREVSGGTVFHMVRICP